MAVLQELLAAFLGVEGVGRVNAGQVAGDGVSNGVQGSGGVGVGAALRLGHDLVYDPEREEVGGGDTHGFGGGGSLAGVVPEYGGAGLGAGHRVDGVFEHEHAVAQADGERAAAAPLTDDGGDDGHLYGEHSHQVGGYGLAYAALFGLH